MGLCFASAGVIKALSVTAFTLAWTHSVEKIEWQEDWRITPLGLQIVEARVKGSGAGMEPPPEAKLVDGWFQWSPELAVQPEVALANSGMAGEWRVCTADKCQTLSEIFGQSIGASVTTMRVCDGPSEASSAALTTSGIPITDDKPSSADGAAIKSQIVAQLLALARFDVARGNYAGGRDKASEAIRIDPQSVEAYETRGDAWIGIQNYDKAIDSYDAAIKIKSDIARLYSRRAKAFSLMHNYRIAVRDYTEAVRLDRSVTTLLDRADSYMRVWRYDLALDDLTDALRLNPTSPELYRMRGEVYSHNNAYGFAISDYNESIRLRPSAGVYFDRANAYQLKGDLGLAIADYDKAIEMNDKIALAYNNRGVALRDKGDRVRAYADFSKAVEIDPTLSIAVAHRKEMALEAERASAQMALKGSKTACAAGVKECAR